MKQIAAPAFAEIDHTGVTPVRLAQHGAQAVAVPGSKTERSSVLWHQNPLRPRPSAHRRKMGRRAGSAQAVPWRNKGLSPSRQRELSIVSLELGRDWRRSPFPAHHQANKLCDEFPDDTRRAMRAIGSDDYPADGVDSLGAIAHVTGIPIRGMSLISQCQHLSRVSVYRPSS